MIVIEDEQRSDRHLGELGLLGLGTPGLAAGAGFQEGERASWAVKDTNIQMLLLPLLCPSPSLPALHLQDLGLAGAHYHREGPGTLGGRVRRGRGFHSKTSTHLLSCWVCWVFYHTNRCLPQSWKLSERGVNSYLIIIAHNGELIHLLVHLELFRFRLNASPGTHGTVPK